MYDGSILHICHFFCTAKTLGQYFSLKMNNLSINFFTLCDNYKVWHPYYGSWVMGDENDIHNIFCCVLKWTPLMSDIMMRMMRKKSTTI